MINLVTGQIVTYVDDSKLSKFVVNFSMMEDRAVFVIGVVNKG